MARWVEELLVGEHHQLAERIAALPSGYRLCMHDDTRVSCEPMRFDVDTITIRVSQEGHMLAPDDTCTYRGSRTEYIPRGTT